MPDKKEGEEHKFLTVAPFECAWRKDLRFREAGRGCVAFEAFAHNDVTLVFREQVGSQHYHYKMDNCPHYTVIIGSHRNRRLRIEVDGKTVVDVAGVGLCCSSSFQSYWISFYDGLISIGKGRYPFQNLVFQWRDSMPNCSVQYIGLSSWDKHVGYRNVNVLPLTQKNHLSLWRHVDYGESDTVEDGNEDIEDESTSFERWGLENFLESGLLADVSFIVGEEERVVPAHKVILRASGSFNFGLSNSVRLGWVTYPVLHALLQYIYTGQTQILESQLSSLRALSLHFEVMPLAKQCEEIIERFKLNKRIFESGKNVRISYPSCRPPNGVDSPFGIPVNMQRLKQMQSNAEHTDVDIYIEGHGLVARSHKIILSLWSLPFTKMFTNGMRESIASNICLKDESPGAFEAVLDFMYSGQVAIEDTANSDTMLLQLLMLADKYGVSLLHQECCRMLLECVSEGWSSL